MPTPQTRTRTSHSLAIKVAGQVVGLISNFGYSLNRTVTPVYELNPDTSGTPVDNVPGNVTDLTIDVQRVDLYALKMEQAFTSTDLSMLSDQEHPFEIYETWSNPDGSTEMYLYQGCWFTKISRSHDVEGNRIVKASGNVRYLSRIKLS